MAATLQIARALLPGAIPELLNKPNVVATGIGYKIVEGKPTTELSIICSVEVKKSKQSLSKSELLPQSVQEVPIDVVPTGVIYAQNEARKKYRPAPGGISVGHFRITAGTLGIWVKKNGKFYMLSNNHVLANTNDAAVGDPILQMGPTDGGRNPEELFGRLSEFIPIRFPGGDGGGNGGGDGGNGGGSSCKIANFISKSLNVAASAFGSETRLAPVKVTKAASASATAQSSNNLVDAALAEPVNQSEVKNDILNIGTITQTGEAQLGMNVKKMGRTTGFTTGTINQIDVTTKVNFGSNRVGTFTDQLLATPMSQGGDSGSAVVSDDNKLVGLLFAGSNNSTIINPIQAVFSALRVSLP